MNNLKQYCSQCVLTVNYPFIVFDQEGVCNYCHDHKTRKPIGEEKLIQSIEYNRNPNSNYDCLVGLSGGRDSTFLLYYVTRKLGFKVLACTFDNGFMPSTTWENINNAVKTLGVDHVVMKSNFVRANVEYMLSGLIRKPSPAMVSLLCAGCRTGYVRAMKKIAKETGCRRLISGGGEPEDSFADMLLADTPNPNGSKLIAGFIHELINNPYYILHPVGLTRLLFEFNTRYMPYTQKSHIIRFLPLFYFIEWDEEMIMKTITTELNWRTPDNIVVSWRSDCKIHQIRQYLYNEMIGYTKNNNLLSQMIRNNQINRKDAMERLINENRVSPILLEEILAEMGFSLTQINNALSNQNFID